MGENPYLRNCNSGEHSSLFKKNLVKYIYMYRPETKAKIESELAGAEMARANGLEGRARVCARRAAGIAIRDYVENSGLEVKKTSANDLLIWLKDEKNMPETARRAAEYLLTRVNEDYQLPIPVDLLSEARKIVTVLETLDSNK